MGYLNVGEGGLVFCAEVYEFFASINEALFPEFFKSIVDCVDYFLVERKGKAFPVSRCTKSTDLELHIAALLVNKIPNLTIEIVATEIEASLPF